MKKSKILTLGVIALALLVPANPQAASASISTGAVGPAGELWLPEVDDNTIAVLDTATGKITKRLPVGPFGSRPAVLAVADGGNKIYSDNFGVFPATVSIFNRDTGSRKTLPVQSTPLGIFTSLDEKEIYVPEIGFVIEVIDVATDRIVRRFRYADIPVGSIAGPDGLMYVGFMSGTIAAYNPKTGALVKPPISSGGVATFWYTFSADGKKLYTDTVNRVGVIDVDAWKLTKTVTTGTDGVYSPLTDPGAFTSTLSPDGKKLYVSLFPEGGVRILDTTTDQWIGHIPTSGATPSLTFSKDGTRGYISDFGPQATNLVSGPLGETVHFLDLVTIGTLTNGRLITFDPRTDEVLGTLPTGAGPGVAAWVEPRP